MLQEHQVSQALQKGSRSNTGHQPGHLHICRALQGEEAANSTLLSSVLAQGPNSHTKGDELSPHLIPSSLLKTWAKPK